MSEWYRLTRVDLGKGPLNRLLLLFAGAEIRVVHGRIIRNWTGQSAAVSRWLADVTIPTLSIPLDSGTGSSGSGASGTGSSGPRAGSGAVSK